MVSKYITLVCFPLQNQFKILACRQCRPYLMQTPFLLIGGFVRATRGSINIHAENKITD